jgi:predicted Zn-dependent peptidase
MAMAISSQPFFTHTLPQGLRIICAPGQTDAVYMGIAVRAGTRHELATESGMAHFTEHMSFKGTLHRSSRQVISCMENVGGELNAYTGKEETVYYCTSPKQHVARAIDLLLDLALCSTYPQEEMSREVEVVIDEIESYRDLPAEHIYDEFESLIFPEHPLGRNILGDAETLRTFRTADMKGFARRLYHPENMLLYVLGNVDPEKIVRMAEKTCHTIIGNKPHHYCQQATALFPTSHGRFPASLARRTLTRRTSSSEHRHSVPPTHSICISIS